MAKKKSAPYRTSRGFRNYTEFVDSYGSNVAVRQSSSAELAAVWVFCSNPGEKVRNHLGDMVDKDTSPHLTVPQAERLAKALMRFVKEARGGRI